MIGHRELRAFYGSADVSRVLNVKRQLIETPGVDASVPPSGEVGPHATELSQVPLARGSGSAGEAASKRSRNRDAQWIQRAQALTASLSGPASAILGPNSGHHAASMRSLELQTTPSMRMLANDYATMERTLANKLGASPATSIWAARNLWWMKQMLQVVMLNMCGQFAVYILTFFHWIDEVGLGAGSHILALFPPIAVLFFLLPWTIHLYAQFEAYAVPRAELLDLVISDEDELQTHLQYVSKQISRRRTAARKDGEATERAFFEELWAFQDNFFATSTHGARLAASVVDLMRGEATTYVAADAVFFHRMLGVLRVPCSRERLEHLVPFLQAELNGEPPSIGHCFDILGLEPPPTRSGGISIRA